VPYGWQFKGEDVCIKSTRGKGMNYLGLLSRNNHFVYEAFSNHVNAERVIQFLDKFSMGLRKQTVVVLDNASIHTAKKFKQCLATWQNRGGVYFLSTSLFPASQYH